MAISVAHKNTMQKDKVYSQPRQEIAPFSFNSEVAEVFDDMITRSVPLYEQVQHATVLFAKKLINAPATIYDLGCSTGTTLIRLRQAISPEQVEQAEQIKLVGVDNSAEMLKVCAKKLAELNLNKNIELINDQLPKFVPKEASLVILNYTLQFLQPELRAKYISTIYENLKPNGALILTEKLTQPNQQIEKITTELYYDFKRQSGYSDLEISQKREALEKVLIPLSLEENLVMLRNAGFQNIEIVFKWLPFASFLAVK